MPNVSLETDRPPFSIGRQARNLPIGDERLTGLMAEFVLASVKGVMGT
jgi:hypothetical protein